MPQKVKDSSLMDVDEEKDFASESIAKKRVTQIVIDVLVIVAIFVIFGCVYFLVEPKIRYFTCNEDDIFYPYQSDTVPLWAVGVYGSLAPILAILVVELVNSKIFASSTRSKREALKVFLVCFFHALSLFALGIASTLLLTEIGKRWVGRLRPHFIAVCQPVFSQINCTSSGLTGVLYNAVYTGGSFCTGDAALVKEARFSFPSGHSSFAWYCMIFFIVYLEARLRLLRLRYLKSLFQMAAFIAAYVTSLSRIADFHHRGTDVIGGSVLGIVISLFITLVLGRVLWKYEVGERYYEIDQKYAAKRQVTHA